MPAFAISILIGVLMPNGGYGANLSATDFSNAYLYGVDFGGKTTINGTIFGSAILAIAVLRGWLSGEQAFELSRLDEAYQEEKWGVDAEAAERTARLFEEAGLLQRWFEAAGGR